MNRALTPLLVVVVALLAVSCRSEDNSVPDIEQQDRIIATASLTDDPSELFITWFPAPCETFDEVEVMLDDEFARLRVRVTVDIGTCPINDVSSTTVSLGEPLGDRLVFDRAFGDTVALSPTP